MSWPDFAFLKKTLPQQENPKSKNKSAVIRSTGILHYLFSSTFFAFITLCAIVIVLEPVAKSMKISFYKIVKISGWCYNNDNDDDYNDNKAYEWKGGARV